MKKTRETKAFESVVERLIRASNARKEIISNYEYINWLEKFTDTYPKFSSDTWLYEPDTLSSIDSENVDKLCHFFEAIRKYTEDNFIEMMAHTHTYGEYSCIKYNNNWYEIGICVGQGSFVYVERIEPQDTFIDFECIVKNIQYPKVNEKKELMHVFSEDLEKEIAKLISNEIPKDLIIKTLESFSIKLKHSK